MVLEQGTVERCLRLEHERPVWLHEIFGRASRASRIAASLSPSPRSARTDRRETAIERAAPRCGRQWPTSRRHGPAARWRSRACLAYRLLLLAHRLLLLAHRFLLLAQGLLLAEEPTTAPAVAPTPSTSITAAATRVRLASRCAAFASRRVRSASCSRRSRAAAPSAPMRLRPPAARGSSALFRLLRMPRYKRSPPRPSRRGGAPRAPRPRRGACPAEAAGPGSAPRRSSAWRPHGCARASPGSCGRHPRPPSPAANGR